MSFKSCGISVKTDGSEDADIHFLKSGCVSEDAACEIAQCTADLEADEMDSDEDPFADVDQGDEQLDMNEIVIVVEEPSLPLRFFPFTAYLHQKNR